MQITVLKPREVRPSDIEFNHTLWTKHSLVGPALAEWKRVKRMQALVAKLEASIQAMRAEQLQEVENG